MKLTEILAGLILALIVIAGLDLSSACIQYSVDGKAHSACLERLGP